MSALSFKTTGQLSIW